MTLRPMANLEPAADERDGAERLLAAGGVGLQLGDAGLAAVKVGRLQVDHHRVRDLVGHCEPAKHTRHWRPTTVQPN